MRPSSIVASGGRQKPAPHDAQTTKKWIHSIHHGVNQTERWKRFKDRDLARKHMPCKLPFLVGALLLLCCWGERGGGVKSDDLLPGLVEGVLVELLLPAQQRCCCSLPARKSRQKKGCKTKQAHSILPSHLPGVGAVHSQVPSPLLPLLLAPGAGLGYLNF